MPRPTVICLTPVRNEAWILERFLRCASLWADHIVIADQRSDDGSPEIARRFPKVLLIANDTVGLDEAARQRLLLAAARRIAGPRLLVTLDRAAGPVRREWLAGYEQQGIDMTSVGGGPPYWFDREVVAMIDRHGARHFRRQAIWDADWAAQAARYGCGPRERFLDPRSRRQQAVHAWLRLTQRRRHRRVVRWTDAWLQRRGW